MDETISIDDELVASAVDADGFHTAEQVVAIALEEFIARRNRAKIVDLFYTIEWDPTFHHKQSRQRR